MSKFKTDLAFDKHVDVVRAFYVAQAAKLGFNMTWYTDVFTPFHTAWSTAFATCLDPAKRTHAAVVAKDNAREALEPKFSQMVEMMRSNPDVTDDQLASIEIPRRHPGSNKPLPPPSLPPVIVLETPAPEVVEIHVYNAENMKRAKPPGGKGCFMVYVVLPASAPAPAMQEELTERIYISAGKGKVRCPRNRRGEIFYASGHWVNATGETGPWSDIVSIAIP
jgi:hypothetical protein